MREGLEQGKATQRSVEVVELYKPHGSALSLCEKLGFRQVRLVLITGFKLVSLNTNAFTARTTLFFHSSFATHYRITSTENP